MPNIAYAGRKHATPVLAVHASLHADEPHTNPLKKVCPVCLKGYVGVRRNFEGAPLDRACCNWCYQWVAYTDERIDGRGVVGEGPEPVLPPEKPTAWARILTSEEETPEPEQGDPLQRQIDDALHKIEQGLCGQEVTGALLGSISRRLTQHFGHVIVVMSAPHANGMTLTGYALPNLKDTSR